MRKLAGRRNTSVAVVLLNLLTLDCAHAQRSPTDALLIQSNALTADSAHGYVLYLKHCTGCHGRHGWGDGPKAIPALAGQREFYLVEQLAEFVTRDRDSSLMLESTHPADVDRPQAFRDLAAYLARAPKNPQIDHGEGRTLSTGATLYASRCAACHGKSGEGKESGPIPAIGGQHYDYLLGQLKGFAVGHRANAQPPDANLASGLSAAEQESLADYVSRMSALVSTESGLSGSR